MKHLLTGVAIAAALALAAPAWAQAPSGGNSMGTPGPNPGGPGLTPYSGGGGAPPPAAAPAPSESTSAAPPAHRRAHRAHARRHVAKRAPALSGDTTAQLNREELARIQAGALNNPPAPAAPPGQMQESMPPSGRAPGPKPSGSGYIPPAPPPPQ